MRITGSLSRLLVCAAVCVIAACASNGDRIGPIARLPGTPAPAMDVNLTGAAVPSPVDEYVKEDAAPTASGTTSDALPIAVDAFPLDPPTAVALGPSDLWERIRAGMALPEPSRRRIDAELRWYRNNPDYLDRVGERASPYLFHIVEEVEKRDFPRELALLPIVESAFRPFAYSPGRASGIWQFIPATGRRYGLKQTWWYDGRRDIYASTRAALDYLEKLHRDFGGDWLLALAAYNSGEGTVSRAVRKNRRAGKPTDFWSLRLPRETRAYVPRLLATARVVKNPARYGIALRPIENREYFTKVDIGGQLDLALAANLAGCSLEELYRLNPGFNRWATDPNGPHYLLIPVANAEGLQAGLKDLPESKRMRWKRHRVQRGDTLSEIAVEHRTTVPVLQQVNGIGSSTIRVGQTLIVPVSTARLQDYVLSADQRILSAQQTPRDGHKIVYTVRPGDTLWEIARKHNVSTRKLAEWNTMSASDVLRPRRRLVIWTPSPTQTAAVGSVYDGAPPSDFTNRTIRYVVRKGDSLSRIARRFNVSVGDLREWNSLPTGRYLQPGQRLKLVVDVTDSCLGC